MTASKRIVNAKSGKYHQNIHKRGLVEDPQEKQKSKISVGPVVLGFILFVVVGSAFLEIIKTATSGMTPPS